MAKFVRFGGLSPVKQKQYIADEDEKTYHNPPKKKGLYCMPQYYLEHFLLGSSSQPWHISNKASWIKDDKGNLIVAEYKPLDDNDNIWTEYEFTDEIKKLLKRKKLSIKYVGTSRKRGFKRICEDDEDHYIRDCDTCPVNKECKTLYLTYLKPPKIFEYNGELWHHLGEHVKPFEIIEAKGSWVKTDMDTYLRAFEKNKHACHRDNDLKSFNEIRTFDPFRNSYNGCNYSKDHLEVFIEKL